MMQYLNGTIENSEIGKIGKGKLKAAIKRGAVKIKNGRVFAKVAAAPMRAAFLIVVDLNGLGLAVKLREALKKDPKAIEKFWLKFGGSMVALQKAIAQGIKTHNKLNPKHKISGELGAAVAASAATAAPIIATVMTLLKQILPIAQTVLLKKDKDKLDEAINEFKANVSEIDEQAEGLPTSEETSNKNKLQYIWGKYKKPILITGGVILAAGITYAVIRKRK